MWRSACASRALLRRRPLTSSVFATSQTQTQTRIVPSALTLANNDTGNNGCGLGFGEGNGSCHNRCPYTRSYSSSATPCTKDNDDTTTTKNNDDDDDNSDNDDNDDEGWVPPMRGQAATGSETEAYSSAYSSALLPNSERIESVLEVSRQVKEHERLDRALEEAEREAEALFQLTEEEQATLTDEEILERLEAVLKREEELQEAMFRKELEREEAEEEREKQRLRLQQQRREKEEQQQETQEAPDWLQTRRKVQSSSSSSSSAVVPVIHHKLLTADEIRLLLEEHGGENIAVIEDDPEAPRMGGAEGMIVCTGGGLSGSSLSGNGNPYLISTLSRVLIDHMKDRKLDELGTAPSAHQNTKNRSAASKTPTLYGSSTNTTTTTSNSVESWKIVDCGNYIVHILDGATRDDLRLEELWSGFDPLWRLDILDEEAVEDYCMHNPVPPGYDGTTGSRRRGRGDNDNDTELDGTVLKRLERNQFGFLRRHRPVVPQAMKNRNRRAGRKQRRLQKERAYFGGE